MTSTFTFKAVDLAGVPAKGELEADSKQAVTDQLRSRGLIVLDINEEKTSLTNKDLFDRFRRIKAHELTVMTRQLATMVAAGVSILRAFHVLEEQTENEKLKEILAEVRQDIEAGISMSDALEKHPDTFDDLYIAMTRTGETAGMLEEALDRIADQLEKADSLRRQVKAAMAYPMMIGIFALVTLLALVTFLIPVFEEVFADFNGKLPFITQISVGASKALRGQWYLFIIGTVGIGDRLQEVEEDLVGPLAVGCDQDEDPGKDRGRDPQDRARALVAHVLRPRAQRRAAAAGDRHHRQDRRQLPHREGDGRRQGLGAARRHDLRAAARRAPCSRRWSPTWSASARRPETWTACSARSPTSTRTRSRP